MLTPKSRKVISIILYFIAAFLFVRFFQVIYSIIDYGSISSLSVHVALVGSFLGGVICVVVGRKISKYGVKLYSKHLLISFKDFFIENKYFFGKIFTFSFYLYLIIAATGLATNNIGGILAVFTHFFAFLLLLEFNKIVYLKFKNFNFSKFPIFFRVFWLLSAAFNAGVLLTLFSFSELYFNFDFSCSADPGCGIAAIALLFFGVISAIIVAFVTFLYLKSVQSNRVVFWEKKINLFWKILFISSAIFFLFLSSFHFYNYLKCGTNCHQIEKLSQEAFLNENPDLCKKYKPSKINYYLLKRDIDWSIYKKPDKNKKIKSCYNKLLKYERQYQSCVDSIDSPLYANSRGEVTKRRSGPCYPRFINYLSFWEEYYYKLTKKTFSISGKCDKFPKELQAKCLYITQKPTENKKIEVSTDKNEYARGEPIHINIKNKLDYGVLYESSGNYKVWGLEYFDGDKWKRYRSKLGTQFQITDESFGKKCSITSFKSIRKELFPKSEIKTTWSQKLCPYKGRNSDIAQVVRYAEAGKYRLNFFYGVEVDRYYNLLQDERTVYSNEFEITNEVYVPEPEIEIPDDGGRYDRYGTRIPDDCTLWYDGCDTCYFKEDELVCTDRECEVNVRDVKVSERPKFKLEFFRSRAKCTNKIPNECVSAGKSADEYSFGRYVGPKECCEGLTKIEAVTEKNSECLRKFDIGTVCSDCGNGVCEEWENSCNCVVDCD